MHGTKFASRIGRLRSESSGGPLGSSELTHPLLSFDHNGAHSSKKSFGGSLSQLVVKATCSEFCRTAHISSSRGRAPQQEAIGRSGHRFDAIRRPSSLRAVFQRAEEEAKGLRQDMYIWMAENFQDEVLQLGGREIRLCCMEELGCHLAR